MIAFAAALAAIDAAFDEPVEYDGAGLAEPEEIRVIWSDVDGSAFQGPGRTTRRVSCEIRQADLPEMPSKTDQLLRDDVFWRPIEVIRRDDIGKWEVVLERLSARP